MSAGHAHYWQGHMVDRSARVNASEGNMDMSDKDPEYRDVVFRDRTADFAFLTRSTAKSDQTIEWSDGNTYPVVDVDISSASHPFWTGRQRPLGSLHQQHLGAILLLRRGRT